MSNDNHEYYNTIEDRPKVVLNRTGYTQPGSENYEHDDTGDVQNFSGVEDEMLSAEAEHSDWQEGYDY